MIWCIGYLARVGATNARFDFSPFLPALMEANRAKLPNYEDYAKHGLLMFGDLGTALLVMRLETDPGNRRPDLWADASTILTVRELMWGMPGSMTACGAARQGL
jgi:hypothetical protein